VNSLANGFVSFAHEIVQNQQIGLPTVEIIRIRQSASKLYIGVSVEHLLVFAITVDYPTRRGIYRDACIPYQFKHEVRLPASRGSGCQCREGMRERQCHDDDDGVDVDGGVRKGTRSALKAPINRVRAIYANSYPWQS